MQILQKFVLAPGRILRPKQYVQVLLGREYRTGVVDKIVIPANHVSVFVRVHDLDNGFNDVVYVRPNQIVTQVVTRG